MTIITRFLVFIFSIAVLLGVIDCKKEKGDKTERPLPPHSVKDVDGNIYKTDSIGTQVWMRENLRVIHYNNGDTIATTIPATLNISNEDAPKFQWAYDGNESHANVYGRLYTWFAATDSRKICPTGWHVPSHTDWSKLITFLGGENVAGGKMKDTGTTYWISTDTMATNESGFTGLPGGNRTDANVFADLSYGGIWWASTATNDHDAYAYCLYYYNNVIGKGGFYMKSGISIRCIRDF